ncbi:MAG: hypothetical protein COA99_06610 [Moraxellaceae bacterium]|nr:MAG: hypothetical protein COA99_06610 [Moraxellaceae bacterium]
MNKCKVFLVSIILILSACSTQERALEVSSSFVGTFNGGNPSRSCGAMWWEIIRHQEGTYKISFFKDSERKQYDFSEQGKWWVKNGYYYAIAPKYMVEPDVYSVKVLSEYQIQFTSSKYDESAKCKDNYRFIDHKVR